MKSVTPPRQFVNASLKNMPHGLTGPDGLTSSSWRTRLVKSTADFGKTTAVSSDPREDLLDNFRLFCNRFKSRLAAAFTDRYTVIVPYGSNSVRRQIRNEIFWSDLLTESSSTGDVSTLLPTP